MKKLIMLLILSLMITSVYSQVLSYPLYGKYTIISGMEGQEVEITKTNKFIISMPDKEIQYILRIDQLSSTYLRLLIGPEQTPYEVTYFNSETYTDYYMVLTNMITSRIIILKIIPKARA